MTHPLEDFWELESGWASRDHLTPRQGLAEGTLCIDTWNAAIEEALKHVVIDGNPKVAREKIESLIYPRIPKQGGEAASS